MEDKFTNVKCCARCNEDHYNLLIKPFSRPIEIGNEYINYFAICPKLNEPILVVLSSK